MLELAEDLRRGKRTRYYCPIEMEAIGESGLQPATYIAPWGVFVSFHYALVPVIFRKNLLISSILRGSHQRSHKQIKERPLNIQNRNDKMVFMEAESVSWGQGFSTGLFPCVKNVKIVVLFI